MKRWLGVQNVKDETTPADTLTDAGLTIERPRIEVVNTKGMERITRSNPPPGMFVVNYETGRLNQWVGDHWEVVAEHTIGQPPYGSGDDDGRPNMVGFRNALFGSLGSVGGGGVSPAPRGPNDPSVTQPLPGGTPSLTSSSNVSPFSITVNPTDTSPPFSLGGLGPPSTAVMAHVIVVLGMDVIVPDNEVQADIYQGDPGMGGVVVMTGQNTEDLVWSSDNFPSPVPSFDLWAEVTNNSAVPITITIGVVEAIFLYYA